MQPKKIASMEKASLDRRSFLRLCAVTAGGAVLAACQQTLRGLESAASSTGTVSPIKAVQLSIPGADHDAWTWVKSVPVGVSDPAACEAVLVAVNGREFGAKPEEDHFTAEIQLSEGENQVSAICKQSGGEVESAPVVYIGRLRQVPTAIIQVAIEDGQIILDGSGSMPAQGTEATLVHHLWTARSSNPASLRLKGGELTGEANGELLPVLPPTVDGEYYVSLRVVDEEGRVLIEGRWDLLVKGRSALEAEDAELLRAESLRAESLRAESLRAESLRASDPGARRERDARVARTGAAFIDESGVAPDA